jgi:uncharacterized DUF497 family protein
VDEYEDYEGLLFEWDALKAERVHEEHEIDFRDAMSAFADPLALTIVDREHSIGEDRFVTIGETARGNLVVVSHTPRGRRIRLITARRPTSAERHDYEQG